MTKIIFTKRFLKNLSKIKDKSFREQVDKQIEKIADNPDIGKPMRYKRKWTKDLYVGSHRLAYSYTPDNSEVIFISIYHKDEQ